MIKLILILTLISLITVQAQNCTNTTVAENVCGMRGDCKLSRNGWESFGDCDSGYASVDGACNYKQKSQLTAFLVSFFVGWTGADWFYLSDGTAGYVVAGVFKLITLGGVGIWWLVDWIRVLAEDFDDGNGVALKYFT